MLIENIRYGQRVNVKRNSDYEIGIVKYIGALSNIPGLWIGVELYIDSGDHNGTLNGRHYFICRPNHGIFVGPHNVSLLKMSARTKSAYSKTSETINPLDAPLFEFNRSMGEPRKTYDDDFHVWRNEPRRYHLSNHMESLLQQKVKPESRFCTSGISIPCVHMPEELVHLENKRKWLLCSHLPKYGVENFVGERYEKPKYSLGMRKKLLCSCKY